MEPLINVLALWLSLTFSLPASADHPQVRYVMPERLAAIHSPHRKSKGIVKRSCTPDAFGGGIGKGAALRTADSTLRSSPVSPELRKTLTKANPPERVTPNVITTVPFRPGPTALARRRAPAPAPHS